MRKFRVASLRKGGLRCVHCDRVLEPPDSKSMTRATRDHLEPRAHGGERTALACWQCNQLKGSLPLEQWERWMFHNPLWWTVRSLSRTATMFQRPPPLPLRLPPGAALTAPEAYRRRPRIVADASSPERSEGR